MEPSILIGHIKLTDAQAMAVRVAVTAFQMECDSDEGKENLGPIADVYSARLEEVLRLILAR